MKDDIDELPIFANLNFNVHVCSCCGKQNIKRTIEISGADLDPVYLGVTCCGEWFNVNLSGNPYKSISRFNRVLRKLSNQEIENIVAEISEAS